MSTHRAIVTGLFVLLGTAGCEKAPAPPAESATSPVDTSAPAASATTPVAEPAPSAEAPAPTAAAPEVTAAPSAMPAPSAAASSAPTEAVHHGASNPAKEHAAGAPAAPPPPSATGGATPDDPCQTKKFHYAQLSSACHSGGRKAAKVVMKGVVNKAKAAGTDLKCTSCHEDLHDFQLKSNAVGDLKNWL